MKVKLKREVTDMCTMCAAHKGAAGKDKGKAPAAKGKKK